MSPRVAVRVVFEDKLVILFLFTIPYAPGDPDIPPDNPQGLWHCRSPISEMVDPSASTSVSLIMPSPPRNLPRPPDPRTSSYFFILKGYADSSASTGVFNVLVM